MIALFFFFSYSNRVECNILLGVFFPFSDALIAHVIGSVWKGLTFCGLEAQAFLVVAVVQDHQSPLEMQLGNYTEQLTCFRYNLVFRVFQLYSRYGS